jgi:excisionase family DNA binding protein
MSPAAAANNMERQGLPDWKLAYRVDEACAATGYGKTKIWELISAGKLRAKKDGGVTVIRRADLQDYLDNLPDRKAAA